MQDTQNNHRLQGHLLGAFSVLVWGTTFVATKRQERDLRLASNTRYTSVDALDDPVCVVQVLRYDPIPRSGHVIDPLSAILSLTDDERDDPRVMGQIEDVIERVLGGKDAGNR